MRRAVLALALASMACGGGPPSAEQRARDVSAWLAASGGVVDSWIAGSISPAAAESNLESTARAIEDVSQERLPEPLARQLRQAILAVADARVAVSAGNKEAALSKAAEMRSLSRELAR